MDKFGQKVYERVHESIIGQEEIIKLLLISIISEGHSLIIGVPGLAKTLLANSIARVLGLSFSRIQFTPDLMPSDITGTEIIQEDRKGQRYFEFVHGPVFANFVLADEVNRAPPKTQSALLEAMQEKKVNYGKDEYELESPFFVVATQNPIEQEGTYPLPEAQLDRFMFSLEMDYPGREEEIEIIGNPPRSYSPDIEPIFNPEDLIEIQKEVKSIPASNRILEYIYELLRNSRPASTDIDFIKKYTEWGVSPRGGQYLLQASKAKAFLEGRPTPSLEDVRALTPPVFNHRIITNFLAEGEGIKSHDITKEILNETD